MRISGGGLITLAPKQRCKSWQTIVQKHQDHQWFRMAIPVPPWLPWHLQIAPTTLTDTVVRHMFHHTRHDPVGLMAESSQREHQLLLKLGGIATLLELNILYPTPILPTLIPGSTRRNKTYSRWFSSQPSPGSSQHSCLWPRGQTTKEPTSEIGSQSPRFPETPQNPTIHGTKYMGRDYQSLHSQAHVPLTHCSSVHCSVRAASQP